MQRTVFPAPLSLTLVPNNVTSRPDMSPTRHARTRSMPAPRPPTELSFGPPPPTPAELVFCSDAEYRARTLSSPAPVPARLVKARPSVHAKDGVPLRRTRPALDFVPAYDGPNYTRCVCLSAVSFRARANARNSFSPSFDDSTDELPSPVSSRRTMVPAPRRAIVKLWKGITGMRRKPVRDSVAFPDFEWVTPRRSG